MKKGKFKIGDSVKVKLGQKKPNLWGLSPDSIYVIADVGHQPITDPLGGTVWLRQSW